jgi:multiple sugar transport system ATP-binding protein
MAKLRLRNVHKWFGAVHVVKGIDLDIEQGGFTVLVGPSGCGKSTLLRIIAGLEQPDDGTVEIGGRNVDRIAPRDRDVAMVFQNYALYPYMTVNDNMAFPLRMRKVGADETRRRVHEAAEMLGMVALLDRFPSQLSGGQRQRVAMGRAIVRRAQLFLFDEPLSNLDAQLRDDMRTEIKRLHAELGITTVYVTHDQIEAMTLARRIVLMRDGVIEQEGAPLDLYESPATRFVARFLGSPPMNFIAGRLERGADGVALRLAGGTVLSLPDTLARPAESRIGQDVHLGVRPEHLGPWRDGMIRPGVARITVDVDLVEPTGARTYVAVHLGETVALAEFPAHAAAAPGARIDLAVDLGRGILIDPTTERVFARPAVGEASDGPKP